MTIRSGIAWIGDRFWDDIQKVRKIKWRVADRGEAEGALLGEELQRSG